MLGQHVFNVFTLELNTHVNTYACLLRPSKQPLRGRCGDTLWRRQLRLDPGEPVAGGRAAGASTAPWLHSGRAARQLHTIYPSLRQPHSTSWDLSSAVSDSQADCRNAKDKADILAELEKGVGFDKCNALVVGLLREALLAQGRAAFVRLPAAERAGYVLFLSL